MTRPSKREVKRAVDRLDGGSGGYRPVDGICWTDSRARGGLCVRRSAPPFATPAGDAIATDAHDASRAAPLFTLPPEVTDRWSGDVTDADRAGVDV